MGLSLATVKVIETHLGSFEKSPHLSIQNFLGPVLPRRAAKPSYGMLEVPVTNCKRAKRLVRQNKTSLQNSKTGCAR